ncbi:MAG: TIR domain-containing protein [Nevskia sp.]|nr:TIR domain-containing protein [Nevskia sp.]
MQQEPYKYWAFISYSHRDRAWARWLHRALESYRVPRRLVGSAGVDGATPRRIFPVFRDHEELPSSASLSRAIDAALAQSRYLVVIASPYAAVSRWVEQEVARFRALGRGDRILCLIVDGEPHADQQPGEGLLECLPPSLRLDGGAEPIAADVRPGRDGRSLALLKLAAGLLGLSLDQLRRRERRRQLALRLAWCAGALGLAALLAGLWNFEQQAKGEALAQQALRTHIDTVYERGRQELLAHNEARAAVFLEEAYRLGTDTPALRFMLGQAMRIVDAAQTSFQTGLPVRSVRFSPDAKLLLTRSTGDLLRVWQADTGVRLSEFALPGFAMFYGPAFSRDGRLVYFGGVADRAASGFLAVWDARRGRSLAMLSTPPSADRPFNFFDASGRRVVHATADNAVEIDDLETGKAVRRLAGNFSVAGFSRDGRRVITGGGNGEVMVWDGELRRRLQTLRGLQSSVVSLDDTQDGTLVAASAQDGAVRVWQAADGALRLVAGHPSARPLLLFSLDGTRLLTKAADGARVWNTANGALVYAQQFAGAAGNNFDISARGGRVMTSNNSRLTVQDAQTGADLFSLDGHHGLPQGRDISEDDRSIATGGADGRVVLWRMPAVPQHEFVHRVDPLRWAAAPRPPGVAALYGPAASWIATGGGDGSIRLWDGHSGEPIRSIAADPVSVNVLAASADGALIASGGEVEGVKLWDRASGRLLRALDCQGKRVLTVALAPGGQAVAAAIAGGTTLLWDLGSGAQIARFERDQARAGHWSPDGRRYAVGVQGAVKLWDLGARRFAWSTQLAPAAGGNAGEVAAIDFSADGLRVLAALHGRVAALLDVRDGKVLRRFEEASGGEINSILFGPGGERAVSTAGSGGATLWRLADGRAWALRGHAGEVRSAEFSPDGNFVVTAGVDGTARLWDTRDGELLGTVAQHASQLPEIPFQAAAISPDGQRLLTGSVDGVVREWSLRTETRGPGELAAELRCRVPWQLDGDELRPADPGGAQCLPAR